MRSISKAVVVAAVLVAVGARLGRGQEFDDAVTVHRDEGAAARWAHPGRSGDGPWSLFSGTEAVTGSTLLFWNHMALEGLDLATGRRHWRLDGLGNRECGYPDVGIAGHYLVAPAFEDDEDWRRGVLHVVDTRRGAITATVDLGRIERVDAVSCSPCIAETGGVDEREPLSTLRAIDLDRREVVATLPGWHMVSEVEQQTILAQRSDRDDLPGCGSVDLLRASTLGVLWSADIGCVERAWRSGPWWIVAVSEHGESEPRTIIRLAAIDGRQAGAFPVRGLVSSAWSGCRSDDTGIVSCLEGARSRQGELAVSRIDAESGTALWNARLPAEARWVSWWHLAGSTLLVQWHDDSYEPELTVLDWTSGRHSGSIPGFGKDGELSGFADTVVLLRRDASLVAYDVDDLREVATSR